MSPSSRSTIVLPSPEVKRLANACLARIADQREHLIVRAVADERERQRRSWFRRLFRTPVDDDATIRDRLLNEPAGQSLFSFSSTVNMYAWRSEQVAHELLVAARHADSVTVSVADLDWIGA